MDKDSVVIPCELAGGGKGTTAFTVQSEGRLLVEVFDANGNVLHGFVVSEEETQDLKNKLLARQLDRIAKASGLA